MGYLVYGDLDLLCGDDRSGQVVRTSFLEK